MAKNIYENKIIKTPNFQENKQKIISAKIHTHTWNKFTQINKAQGMTNNSALNMIVSKYIRDNSNILSEFNLND